MLAVGISGSFLRMLLNFGDLQSSAPAEIVISTGVQGTLGYGVQGVRRREGFEGVRE